MSRQSRVIGCFFFFSLSAWSRRAGRLLEVLVGDRLFLVLVEPLDFFVDLLQVGRASHGLEPDAGAGLVDHVDRLVGQAAAGDVAARELDGRFARASSVICTRWCDSYRSRSPLRISTVSLLVEGSTITSLEPAIERAVLLDVFAVLVERGGADALDFAAGRGPA